jgi:DNA-binding transcriptional LysR family regulator
VAAIQSLAVTLLPAALASYAQQYPGVEIDAHVAPVDEILRAVRDGRADVGLVAGPTPALPRNVGADRLYREPFVAVVRSTDPLAQRPRVPLSALADRPLVLVPASSPTGATIHAAFAAAGVVPRVRLTIDSGEALRELVRAGVGITILPARYLDVPRRDLRAVALVRPTPWREVFSLTSTGDVSTATTAFVNLIRVQIRSAGAQKH